MPKGIPIRKALRKPLGKIFVFTLPTRMRTRAPWGGWGRLFFYIHTLWGISVFLPIRRIGGRNTYIPQSWVRRYRRFAYTRTRMKGGGL